MEDILQVIPNENLPNLRNILRQGFPENTHVYYFVETSIELKKNKSNENYITFYCPEGDYSDGTFIAIIEMYCYNIIIYTMDKTLNRLKRALTETKIIDFKRKPAFSTVIQTYYDMILEVKEINNNFFDHSVPNSIWRLPREKALQYQYSIPDELYLAPLDETHITIINDAWPHKDKDTEKYLAKVIELYGAVGLFLRENNELCAWVLKNYFGGLGMLQVSEKHKRKGYGSLIVKILSKIIAEKDGYDVASSIIKTNVASRRMFEKLGFEETTPVSWLVPK